MLKDNLAKAYCIINLCIFSEILAFCFGSQEAKNRRRKKKSVLFHTAALVVQHPPFLYTVRTFLSEIIWETV
jgi:hypothetical protein